MADRYFVSQLISGEHAVLDGPEAHHLLHVMRAKPGAEVVLFDGSGAEFAAHVDQTNRATVELAVLARTVVDRELPFELVIGVALPKGDRQKWLVEKLTELGVTRIVPLETERGVAQPRESALERLERSVIEASKQCGRNRLLEIAAPQALEKFLKSASATSVRLFAHPQGADLKTTWNCDTVKTAATIFAAIGPEGGFTETERSRAIAAGWNLVDLGNRILRIETAAIYLASLAAGFYGGPSTTTPLPR